MRQPEATRGSGKSRKISKTGSLPFLASSTVTSASCDLISEPRNAENVVEHEIGSCVKLRTCTYKNFQYENIKYKRLSKDPGLYAAWNLCIDWVDEPFIGNWNVDDRNGATRFGLLVTEATVVTCGPTFFQIRTCACVNL